MGATGLAHCKAIARVCDDSEVSMGCTLRPVTPEEHRFHEAAIDRSLCSASRRSRLSVCWRVSVLQV
jgi:hypothetical protein